MLSSSFFLLSILLHVPAIDAATGLRGQPLPAQMTEKMNRSDVETLLLGELSSVFHRGAVHNHIISLEAELEPMYTAVPKDSDGVLAHAVVRYILHRFFVQKHGWFIR